MSQSLLSRENGVSELRKPTCRKAPERRLTPPLARQRRRLEGCPKRKGSGRKRIPLQRLDGVFAVVRQFLESMGAFSALARRAVQFDIVQDELVLPSLPPALDGVRILHISDLHIDGSRGLGNQLAEACEGLEFDFACITGDLRFDIDGPYDAVINEMRPLVSVLQRGAGVWGVLGNHDCLDMVGPLEDLGMRMLLNECETVSIAGSHVNIAGVDDPHFYGTDDIDAALMEADPSVPTILLSHSPDLLQEAGERDISVYLCGHTHGGQVCLPGGRAFLSNSDCSREYAAGRWSLGRMVGYTSCGVGFSGVPFRAFCRAEIAVHTLRVVPRTQAP